MVLSWTGTLFFYDSAELPYCNFPDSSTNDMHDEISQNKYPRNKGPQHLTSILGPFHLGLRHRTRSGYASVIDDGLLSSLSSTTHVASDVIAHHGRVDADERYPRRPVVDHKRSGELP